MRFNALLSVTLAALLAGCASLAPTEPVQVRVLAINDFHGNLKPPLGGIRIRDPQNPGGMMDIDALERYVQAAGSVAPGALDRIKRLL